jgi:hypothetical protein
MSLNSNPPETDESTRKLRALSEFLGADNSVKRGRAGGAKSGSAGGVASKEAGADSMAEVLYSLMESLDPDALAFLEANPALCQAEYGEEKIAAIIQKTRKAAEGASEGEKTCAS